MSTGYRRACSEVVRAAVSTQQAAWALCDKVLQFVVCLVAAVPSAASSALFVVALAACLTAVVAGLLVVAGLCSSSCWAGTCTEQNNE